MFKFLYYLNILAVAIVIGFYILHGMKALSAQFLLGCYQVVIAFIYMALSLKKNNAAATNSLILYWMFVIIWVFASALTANAKNDTIGIVMISILPMAIACYHVYVTYTFQKQQS